MYIADNNCIRKVYSIGLLKKVSTMTGDSLNEGHVDGHVSVAKFHYPRGLVKDTAGNLYVAGFSNGFYKTAKYDRPKSIVFAKDGLLYVADVNNNRIRRIDMRGNVKTYAESSQGYANGLALGSKFVRQAHLVQNSTGAIFVADWNYVIRKIFY